jgi:sarcosine oxidase
MLERMDRADVLVVGLGAMGAATAYQLSKSGASVIGIDRYSPPHELGASYGGTRLTRQAVGENGPYVPLILRSNEIWRDLEDLTGENILEQTGGLIMQGASSQFGARGVSDFLASTVNAAKAYGIEHRMLDTEDIRMEFPQFQLAEDHTGYYEPGSGFVRPETAIRAQLQLAKNTELSLS